MRMGLQPNFKKTQQKNPNQPTKHTDPKPQNTTALYSNNLKWFRGIYSSSKVVVILSERGMAELISELCTLLPDVISEQ